MFGLCSLSDPTPTQSERLLPLLPAGVAEKLHFIEQIRFAQRPSLLSLLTDEQ